LKEGNLCPNCKEGKLKKRGDDSEISDIRRRLKSFNELTKPGIRRIINDINVYYFDIPKEYSIDKVKDFIKKKLKEMTL
jgi:hypothetical protein